jgi:glycosyltransferase involved in cell wall biosynthesis
MSEPRIAFLIHGLVVGGAEKFFISLVNDLYRSGQNPFVILLSDDNALFPEMDPRVECIIIKRKYKYDLFVGARIKAALKERKIGKVFCVGMFSFFLMKLFFVFEKRIKFILSLHATIPKSAGDYLANLVYFRLFAKRDKAIFICKAQQEYLKKKYLFSPKDSMIIYNGINTSYFSGCYSSIENGIDRYHLRKKYNLAELDKVIVKVARLFPEKGHLYAINALEILHKKFNCKAHILFVGSGDDKYEEKIRLYSQQKKLAGYIHFIEHQADVRPFHCMSDLFTLTSYTTETFSLAALEAMSSGIPCSLTNIGGAAEMINEKTGLLSQSKNPHSIAESWLAILQKKYDPLFLHHYIKSNFSLPEMLEHYRKVLVPAKQHSRELQPQ